MALRVGDKVEFMLGATETRATVLAIRKIGNKTRVLLEVPVRGTSGEVLETMTTVVPIEYLHSLHTV